MIGNKILAKKLYEQYITYCSQNYIDKPVSMTTFGRQIKSFGIVRKKTNKGLCYLDISTDLERVYGDNPFTD
ncbi:DUF3874 domain-containing protein [Clostridium septicum]|uniref:DUF3874 domain-containing protein n=1 Tax=Clostridium septicum TaxID=1504 RepID=UPI001FAA912D|nr:DUF3874 domain-containing protein [Clostridium septicum]